MGRKYCIVEDCTKNSEQDGQTFHRIPSDLNEKKQWLDFIKYVNNWKSIDVAPNSHVCSEHFRECCFKTDASNRKIILKGHFPSMHRGTSIGTQIPSKCFDTTSIPNESTTDEINSLKAQLHLVKMMLENARKAYTDASQEIKNLKAQLQRSEESKTRKRNKIEELTRDFGLLKKQKVSHNQTKSVEESPDKTDENDASNLLYELLGRIGKLKHNQYPDFVRQFAMTLHYLSPRAYAYVREMFQNTLPHPKSLSLWTKFIVTTPGFIDLSMNFIKNKTETHGRLLHYALMFDEIHIRRQILFDGNKMRGYVDHGGITAQILSSDEATSALFIMACEINGKKKIPIGYVLLNGLGAETLHEIIKKSLEKMYDVGGRVLTLTFDGLKSNFKAVEKLGANLKITSKHFRPYVIHPSTGHRVYVIPDPCHMVKLVRNTLSRCETLMDDQGKEIRWKYFEELQKLQSSSGLRAANKLTVRHVQFNNQIMKVKLAVQTLSQSVGTALDVCLKLGIPEFIGCEATSRFIKIVDRMFDALNCQKYGAGFKSPLRPSNKRYWKGTFTLAKQILMELKVKTKTGNWRLLHKTKQGTCVKGLVTCMSSVQQIMEDIESEQLPDLVYLPVYKLSQDLLELFFSVIRSRFGFNNNPNVMQLEHALKRILCMNLKPALTGNCIPQDTTSTSITSTFFMLPEDSIFSPPAIAEELPILPETPSLSSFVSNIVVYIAGFVGRRLCETVKCSTCITALIPKDVEQIRLRSDCILLSEKDNGGLFIPSEDLIKICKICESEVRRFKADEVYKMDSRLIVKGTLRRSLTPEIFHDIREVTDEHPLFSDHISNLIIKIAQIYVKIRLNHLAKETSLNIKPTTNRNCCTKSVIFQGN